MLVKPAPGRKVRDPHSKLPIPESGANVSSTDPYWVRRLAAGDVVEVKAPASPVMKLAPKGKE